LEVHVRTKIKQCLLILCLFLFLFVVIGGGLHLNPGGALIAAATGTPLLVHAFNRRSASGFVEPDMRASSEADGAMCRNAEGQQ
jgi:peptidoglycan/LPS O-acetylase OafA/YrhL